MADQAPNIVYILADDLGFGDLSCFNEESQVKTPHLDKLAREGRRFFNAHANSAVCTPTRYGILTGRYCWRSRLKGGVVGGYTPSLIESDRMTAASFLQNRGYHTACLGKWHLGLDWPSRTPDNAGAPPADEDEVDFSKPVRGGPVDFGFDYFYGISASLDMPPYSYIHNDRVTRIPDRLTRNVDTKAFWREGLTSSDFRHVEVMPRLTEEAVSYVHARSDDGAPFFLYFPLPAPHTPIMPVDQFQGASNTNLYGDFVMQVDWTVGQVMQALEDTNQAENTLFIFTSDNGCSPLADFQELLSVGHNPSYHFRGHKADIFEGGHRIPFIARWPARIPANTVSQEIICLTDLLATCAELLGGELPPDAGEDSFSILDPLLGIERNEPVRPGTVLHSINGSFAIRRGRWKLEMCPDSGGWSYPRPSTDSVEGLPRIQLYDLLNDVGESNNVQADNPDKVEELRTLLTTFVRNGRSTPGPPQENVDDCNWEQLWWMHEEKE